MSYHICKPYNHCFVNNVLKICINIYRVGILNGIKPYKIGRRYEKVDRYGK